MDWEKLVRFCLFWQSSQISPLSKPFFAFPSALMPGVIRNDSMMVALNFIDTRYVSGYNMVA